ncbi:hypothetical protein [Henriciella sp.]|uniref:hypothetical protein n=1 Tax=Henriciella sp. TaxID=1968823 RepID=UPI00260926FE|nr:hypothetical protein [Henriciella sp.]
MISFEESTRLIRMRERLRASTYHEARKDGHGKSSEGAVSISFNLPPVVGDSEAPYWAVEVFSYVLGPSRLHTFQGATAGEAIGKAEDAVGKWCFLSEMEMFEHRYATEDQWDDHYENLPKGDEPRAIRSDAQRD